MRTGNRVGIALLLVALVLSSAGPAGAASPDQVDFEGSGWGHGVGMSQWGAQGMATKGATYQDIVSHYYQGTGLGSTSPGTTIWVNLELDFSSLTLSALDVGSSPGNDVVISWPGGTLGAQTGGSIQISASGPSGCSVVIQNPNALPASLISSPCIVDMSWYQWNIPGQIPPTKIQIEGCSLTDWNATPATSRPCQYARGMLHLRSGLGGLDLSAELLMDDYVLGVSEVPFSWLAEALKAQAVAARSYAESKRIQRGDPATNSCDAWCHVKDSISDQRYVGWGHSETSSWNAAVQATANQVVTHPHSSFGVVTTYYSSSSGGRTEYGHEKGFAASPVEWLTSVDDSPAVDGTVPNPNASWVVSVNRALIAGLLGWDQLTSARVSKTRPGSGSAAEVEFGGINDGVGVSAIVTGSWVRSNLGLKSEYFNVEFAIAGDEMFFYRDDGLFRFYYTHPSAVLGSPILSGTNYTTGWNSITSVDLDGDAQDEMFFYREDGLFRFYHVRPDGSLPKPLLAGDGYTKGWDAITAVDIDGDGQDEMFFYRDDGLFRFYHVRPDGSLPKPLLAGDGYTKGWDAITAVDVDGDGQDEMFFYRDDGLFRFYHVRPDGSLPKPLLQGDGYTKGWSAITAVDLGGDGQDEMFFYRDDGLYRYYHVRSDGNLSSPILSGSDYTAGWDAITSINLDGR